MEEFLHIEIDIICIAIMTITLTKLSLVSLAKATKSRWLTLLALSMISVNVFDIIGRLALIANISFIVPVLYLTNIIYFSSYAFLSYCSLIYVKALHDKSFAENTKGLLICAIPMFVLITLLLFSPFTDLIFTIDPGGVYRRSSLFFLQPLISCAYFLTASVNSFVYAKKNNIFSVKSELTSYSFCTAFIIICSVLQSLIPDRPILVAGASLAILIMYINSLELKISLDPLTGIPNRLELMDYLSRTVKELKPDQHLYFMFIDVDSFKKINDNYGHNEGDRILRTLSSVISTFCKETKSYCARYGGDELVILKVLSGGENINDLCRRLDEHIIGSSIDVDISVGYAKYSADDDSIQDLISRADNAMYLVKQAKKQSRLK